MALETSSPPTEKTLATWQQQVQHAIRDPLELCRRLKLPSSYEQNAVRAAESFPVFVPENYLQRIRLTDPNDPLLRQVLPLKEELQHEEGFRADPVGDLNSKRDAGLIQKYEGRVLLITTGTCAIHCRYCFRRHYPYNDDPRSLEQWKPAIQTIADDHTIHEVILSGGDPLSLSDERLSKLVVELDRIPHLRRLRVHTRLPIVIPDRVTRGLIDLLSDTHMQCYFVIHANHPNELSDEVLGQIRRLRASGMTLLNQAVLLSGVNDDVFVLHDLCEQLSDHGVLPYYLHQLDKVQGAAHFEVPIAAGKQLVEELRARLPGYAVPRYVQEIAGETGKVSLL